MKRVVLSVFILVVVSLVIFMMLKEAESYSAMPFSNQCRSESAAVYYDLGVNSARYLWKTVIDKLGIKNPFDKLKWFRKNNDRTEKNEIVKPNMLLAEIYKIATYLN